MNSPLSLSTEALTLFPANYATGRARFLAMLEDCPLPVKTRSHRLNDHLSTESAWIGPPDASKVVVLISATHGVEGVLGAAVQMDWLTRGAVLPSNTAMLMVFALNPYGFAESRRCDEQGIDLNRNFVDFAQPLPQNEGYGRLQDAIFCDDSNQRRSMLDQARRELGREAYEIAISGGQYSDPHGPFFGGTGPAHGNRVIEAVISDFGLDSRHLAVVDIHSGLGPYGHGELVNDHPLGSNGFDVAKRWYGASVASPAVGDSSSVRKEGLLDYRWHALMQERGCFVTLEFGTYPVEALFEVVLEDHRSWKSGNPAAKAASTAAMREHFCPADACWRELVLVKARQVICQAMDGLKNG